MTTPNSPYAPPSQDEINASQILSRYQLMHQMAQQAAPGPQSQGPYSAIETDPAPVEPRQQQNGSHQRGDIVRMPDGTLRLIKQTVQGT